MDEINLYTLVKVELTPKGKTILLNYAASIASWGDDPSTLKKRFLHSHLEKDGAKFMVWEIMHIFGAQVFIGAGTPFVDNKITIVRE